MGCERLGAGVGVQGVFLGLHILYHSWGVFGWGWFLLEHGGLSGRGWSECWDVDEQ